MAKDLVRGEVADAEAAETRAKEVLASLPGKEGLSLNPVEMEDYFIPGMKRRYDHSGPTSTKLSLDAKFSLAISADGTPGIHVAGNVVPTAQWLNLAKNIFQPGAVQLAVDQVRLAKQIADEPNPKLLDALKSRLQKKLIEEDSLFQIALKTPYTKASRLANASTATVKRRGHELRTGKPIGKAAKASTTLRKDYFYTGKASAPRKNWVPGPEDDYEERLMPLVEEIIKAGSIEVSYGGKDDCPFPGPDNAVPDDWCWWMAWKLFGDRLLRMWLWCNGCWVLVDTTETLFCEFPIYISAELC